MEEWTIFAVMREFIFWSSPVVLLMGIILLTYTNYSNFEKFMSKEYGLRKRIIPKFEKNIYFFHEWCLKKHTLIGLVCMIYGVAMFLILKKIPPFNEGW